MNNEPVAWMRSDWSRVSLYEGDLCTIPLYTHPVKELTDRIAELENQLGFIASINRAGLGVVTATPMASEKIEKIWNAIEEQKDDNFHYGWKKCEQYYGLSNVNAVNISQEYVDKTQNNRHDLTDDEIVWLWVDCEKTGTGATYINFARAILRKASE